MQNERLAKLYVLRRPLFQIISKFAKNHSKMQTKLRKNLLLKVQKVETIFYILAKSVQVFLDFISLAMMIRWLLPIFADVEENKLFIVSVATTEPIIAPVRFLLDKFGIGQDTPFDIGFMATYMLIMLVDLFLPII